MIKRLTAIATAASLLMSGCSNLIGVKRAVDTDQTDASSIIDQSLQKIPANQAEGALLYTSVLDQAWLGAEKVKLSLAQILPAEFTQEWTFIFPESQSIATVAERITKVTGVPVKLSPDVFVSASVFMPKATGGSASTGSSAGGSASGSVTPGSAPLLPPPPLPPTLTGSAATSQSLSDYSLNLSLTYVGTLQALLDRISAKTGLSWEYKDGSIRFSRLVTRTFTVKSTPGNSQLQESIGKTANGGGTQSGGSNQSATNSFQATSQVTMGSSFSVWDNMKDSIAAMLTPVGKVAVTEATGTVTVTDTKEVVDQIGTMIEQINHSLTRQVSFKVEVLSVQLEKDAQYGVNWNAVFNKVTALNPSWAVTFGSPTSQFPTGTSNQLGYQVLSPAGTTALSGSQVMAQAMSTLGKTNVVTTASAVTLNRQPVPVAITDQVGYVQSVSVQNIGTQSTSSVAQTTVQINPATVTTGFILNLLPSISDDDSILLQFSVDISTLKSLETFGTGASAVQQPDVSAMQFMNRVGLKNGQTLVLNGFERTSGQYDQRTLGEKTDLLMGGSLSGNHTREATVILITPVVSQGD